MKKTVPPTLKLRYNLCHRLRSKGVRICTDAHSIYLNHDEKQRLGKTALRYVKSLTEKYQYVVQTYIPDG